MAWNFKSWYQEHGKELNETRRNKYNTDPEYRDRVLGVNKESRRKQREEELKERKIERRAVKIRPVQLWRCEEELEGHPGKKFLTIGALVHALGRSKMWIRLMEKEGVIPATPYRNSRGDRLYLPEDVVSIKRALEKSGRLDSDKKWEFAKYVVARVQLSDGTVIEAPLFRVGVVAEAVGRSLINFEQLEKRGILPVTPFKLALGRRYYTIEQVEAIKQAFDKRPGGLRGEAEKGQIRQEILEAWRQAKLDGAKILEVKVNQVSDKSRGGNDEVRRDEAVATGSEG